MAYDITLRALLGRGAPALLTQLVGSATAEILPTDFPTARERRPDLLLRLADGTLHHVEIQARRDAAMAWRMLEYYGLVARRHDGGPVHQTVLVIGEGAGGMPAGIEHPSLCFRYKVVDLRSLDPAPLLESPAVEDNILAILCAGPDARATVRAILERLAGLDAAALRDALAQLVVLAELRGVRPLVFQEVESMPITVDLSGNPFFVREHERGLAKGLAKGEVRGRAAILKRQLEKRFGLLADAVQARIEEADIATLDAWSLRVLDAPDLDSVLDGPPKPS